ncbi:MAG: hypothetical protein IMY70_07115 [Bacteroidetes bacterium]|nr:hypothetical protein [Bacteroidota bacterium]
MKFYTYIIVVLLSFIGLVSNGQSENKLIRNGNHSYDKGDFKAAEIDYLKSMQTDNPTYKGLYNLGDALYQQNNYLDATAVFDSVSSLKLNKQTLSEAYYNMGNSLLKLSKDSSEIAGQALPASIESFKNSLRINPNDMDTKYNLAYAQRLLNQQQQQDKQENQYQDKQENQEQDQQDQGEQDKQNKEERQNQQNQQQPKPKQISKEDAERMLEALKNEEKKTLEKLQKIKAKSARRVKSEKDW